MLITDPGLVAVSSDVNGWIIFYLFDCLALEQFWNQPLNSVYADTGQFGCEFGIERAIILADEVED